MAIIPKAWALLLLGLFSGAASASCVIPIVEQSTKRALGQSDRSGVAYRQLVKSHAQRLRQCRQTTWPKTQAIWLRLYPGDALPGVMEDVLDRIVNRGYSHVFVEVFYDGRVLLPVSQNPTPWRSVTEEAVKTAKLPPDADLWRMVLEKGRERGLQVYGWMFTLNFGYDYGQNPDRAERLARNGKGETSVAQSRFDPQAAAQGRSFYLDPTEREHLFIDPYHPQTAKDLQGAVAAFAQYQPDGMLFDYIRYPNTYGKTTLIDHAAQLWIYSPAARQALLNPITDSALRTQLENYLDRGGNTSDREQWARVTEHAYNGILSFSQKVTQPIPSSIPIGAVFFPGGNRREGDKLDTRMQPWNRFPPPWQRHAMTYGLCLDGKCVAKEVETVLAQSSPKTLVCPVLAGVWQKPMGGHAPLEVQMQAIRARTPQISCLSHFVYGWIEPESDRKRKFLIAP